MLYNIPQYPPGELALTNHSLVATLKTLPGNARGCVVTEPLWGIPYNLFAPYVSVYMLALGLTDGQIGLITSIGLGFQVFWALLSGALTDKFGRKRTTLVSDFMAWSVPCLIWAVAQDFRYFLIAAIFNSLWRIPQNSWTCLLVEDTDPGLLVDIYSWIYIANLVAAFLAPIGGMLIIQFSLVPAVRGLYLLGFVMMTAKFLATNVMVTETRQGRVRLQETRGQPLFSLLRGSRAVLRKVLGSPITLATIGLMVVLGTTRIITGTFWSILATEKLLIRPEDLPFYQLLRSVVMLLFFFLVMPRLRHVDARKPMILGFSGLVASQALLVVIPPGNQPLLIAATLLEACSIPAVSALLDKLLVLVVDPAERARIMAMLYVVVIVLTSPFGWIAGQASEINRALPFALNIVFYGVGLLLSTFALRLVPGPRPASTPTG